MENDSFTERLKKNFTMKKAIKALTIVGGLLLIVFMTVANVTLDPSKINWATYATNALIMVGIMVFGLVMGESVGEDRQTEKRGGLYQTNLGLFYEAKTAVEGIEIYFQQFYDWYKEKQTYSKRIDYLVSEGGFTYIWAKAIVDHLELADVDKLTKQTIIYEKEGKRAIVKRISPEQAKIVKEALNGSVRINAPSYTYYLSANAKGNKSYTLEQEAQIKKSIALNKGANRGFKILMSLGISAIWAMVTVNDFMDSGSGQAWLNLISRLTSFVTSFCSGWATSVVDVRLQALLLENKGDVLRYFRSCVDNKEFTPKTYEEEAQALYEEEEAQRKAHRESVIDPEIVPTIDNITMIETKEK